MSVKHNFIYNLIYQILALILPLLTAPYVSRALGASNLGVYSYTYSIAYYFVLVAMLGVNNYGNREVARVRENAEELKSVFWEIWTLQFVLSVICTTVYLIYSVLVSENVVISLIWIPYVISAAFDINWLFFGLEQFKLTATRNTIIKIITVILTLCLVRGEYALEAYVFIMAAQFFISASALWPIALREAPPTRVSPRGVISHLKPNLVLFVPVIAVSLYTVLDKVMLGAMSTMEQAGYFENAFKVANMPFTIITALGTVMLPHATNLYAAGRNDEAVDYMAPSMWMAMLLSSAFCFGLITITPELTPVFFGPGYDPCTEIMTIIVLDMPFMAWANVIRTQWLIPTGRDRSYIVSVIIGAIVNLSLNYMLIPTYGAIGAAVGTLAAEISVCVVQTIAVRKDLPLRKWFTEMLPGLLIGVITLVAVRLISTLTIADTGGLLIEIAATALIFIAQSVIWYSATNNPYAERLFLSH